LSAADLQAMGFVLVLHAVTALFSAARAVEQALASLSAHGTPRALAPAGMSYAAFAEIVGLPTHQRLDEAFGALA
jgi:2-methylisocitrate lyase-like PEP mutase family enzyme